MLRIYLDLELEPSTSSIHILSLIICDSHLGCRLAQSLPVGLLELSLLTRFYSTITIDNRVHAIEVVCEF